MPMMEFEHIQRGSESQGEMYDAIRRQAPKEKFKMRRAIDTDSTHYLHGKALVFAPDPLLKRLGDGRFLVQWPYKVRASS